ncbi:MAG: glycosyltransferase family 2 protein [Candidatus Omnitrophica bacterium]|nr:glycosyltransferase family 2 protein [Candidatus Omnitrophota bacterium]
MNIDKKLIAIIPALNEENKIGLVVSRIRKESPVRIDEILVIDDGSKDNTSKEAKDNGAVVISHDFKKGVGSAIRTGIDYALNHKYDIAIVLGGDNQDDPGQINRLLSPIVYDHFDFVQGSRYMAGGKRVNIPLFRRITTHIYALLFQIIAGFPISDGTNGFRAFRLTIFDDKQINIWQDWLDHYELEPYLFYKAIESNCKVTEAPVTKTYHDNNIGYTKMIPILGWWSILRPLILLKFGIKK